MSHIDDINLLFDRYTKLCNQYNLSVGYNKRSMITRFMGFEDEDYWDHIAEKITSYLKEEVKDHNNASIWIYKAINHLRLKETLTLSDREPASSKAAYTLDLASKVAVFGFFGTPNFVTTAQRDGVGKTTERLPQIEGWIDTLERQLNPVKEAIHEAKVAIQRLNPFH